MNSNPFPFISPNSILVGTAGVAGVGGVVPVATTTRAPAVAATTTAAVVAHGGVSISFLFFGQSKLSRRRLVRGAKHRSISIASTFLLLCKIHSLDTSSNEIRPHNQEGMMEKEGGPTRSDERRGLLETLGKRSRKENR